MNNIEKSEVNTSYSRNDECSVSASDRKCEVKTENTATVTSNGKQNLFNKGRCGGYLLSSDAVPDVKLPMCDLSDKDPDFLLATIKELQKKIVYTERMNWLCKLNTIDNIFVK